VEEIDRKIVSLLARNGRMSFTELARQAGLSVSAVHQRVRRLEQDGVIKGYVALFDPEDIGLPLTAFVSIKPFEAAAPDDVPSRLEHLSAIEACHSVAGDENYILKVRVASPVALEELINQIRTLGKVSTRTTVVLSTPFENRPPNLLSALLAGRLLPRRQSSSYRPGSWFIRLAGAACSPARSRAGAGVQHVPGGARVCRPSRPGPG
jgi:Lrp/AsnC family transcriptional regulator, leucine-responsive regulatory protein